MCSAPSLLESLDRWKCRSDPEDLSGDVGDPVLLQCVALGVLHQVRDGTGATELHHQLDRAAGETEKRLTWAHAWV